MRNILVALLALVAVAVAGWLILSDPPPEPPTIDAIDAEGVPSEAEDGPALKGSGAQAPAAPGIGTGRFRIHGKVVNAQDEPLPGTRVKLRRTVHRWPSEGYASMLAFNVVRIRARARALLAGRDRNLETLGEVIAGEDGRFEFRVSEGGSHYVSAQPAPPAAGGTASAYLIDKQSETAEVTVRVFEGAALEGRVEDAAGNPIAALVLATRSGWRGEVGSDASGAFRFAAVPLGKVSLSVTLPSGRQITGFSAQVPSETPVILRIRGGSGSVSGTVSSTDGSAVPGALVTLYLTLPAAEGVKRKPAIELAVKTDAAGRYALTGLPTGEFTRLGAVAEGFLSESRYARSEGWAAVPLGDGANATIDLTLRRGSEIHGRVTRKNADAPLPGATVTLYYLGWRPPQAEVRTTDAEGRYRFEGIDHGKFFLLASHPTHYSPEVESAIAGGYERATREPPAQLAVQLTREDQRVERNLVLLPGRRITGQVVDPGGRAAEGARVYVQSNGLQGAATHWGVSMMSADFAHAALSSEDGSFSIDGLAPRADWALFARKEGYAATESDPVDLSAGPAEAVTLRLAPQCVLRGHVFDAEGQPLASQDIYIGGYTTLRGGDWKFTSKEDGSFEIHSLPAAMINLTTRHGSDSIQLKIDGLKPGEVREGLELRFGGKVQIAGRVTNSRGEPVRGVTLRVRRLDKLPQGWQMASTDENGTFRIESVAPGRVQLWRYAPPDTDEKLTEPFDAPASDVAITFDPPQKVTIEGVVLGPDGKPIELCSVGARSGDNKQTRTRTVHGGSFKLEVKGKPPYAVYATKPRLSDGTPMNVRRGGETVPDPSVRVTIRLEAGAAVAGRVVDANDKGVANVTVVAAGGTSASSDVDGAWRLIGLVPGRVGLTAKPPAGFITPQPLVVDTGNEQVEFRLQKGTHIRGRVLVPEGSTLLGGSVRARWIAQGRHAGGSVNGTVKPSGTFSVSGIPPEVRVSLEIRPFQDQAATPRLASKTLDDVLSGRIDVEITLEVGVAISGTVVNADGTPLTEGSVSLRGDGTGWSKLDEKGHFRAEGLRPGTFHLQVFDAHGPRSTPRTVTAPSSGVRIVLPETGSIAGKLLDAPNPAMWTVRAVDPTTGEDSARQSAIDVGADGSWKIGPIDEGRPWVVVARDKTGKSDQYALSAPVEVGADDVRLTLKTGASIQGHVERQGKSAPQCWIRVQGPGWQSYAVSDAHGSFTLRGLPPGRYTLTAGTYSLRMQGTREGVEAGATGVVIELDQALK